MILILPLLPDPTDIVIQGEQIIPPAVPFTQWFVIQGELPLSTLAGQPVPRALVGQSDWYGTLPRTTGPKVMSGGEVAMLDIGAKPTDPFVDPIQRWLNSVFQVDKAGFMMSLYDAKTIGAPEAFAQFMLSEPEFNNPVVTIPRGAVFRSGLAKRTTAPVIPASFGRHTSIDDFVESTRRWFVSGTTRDGTGAALGNSRVVLAQSNKILVNPDILANPILADVVSDAGGAYSIQVSGAGPFQGMGYKAGSPDLAGVTRNDVAPDATADIYMRDPTTFGGGGGLAARVIGSPIVRRVRV